MKRIVFVALIALSRPLQADSFWQRVTWTTTDKVQMVGLYHPAKVSGTYTWVLLHGLGSNKEEWEILSRGLAAQGNGVFIYDARGHHESDHLASGETLSYKSWTTAGPGSPWSKMSDDLSSAVRLLKERFSLPENRIAVGGASLGANVAMVYAGDHPKVPALLLVSPGMEYAGVNIQEAWKRYGTRPLMMTASPGDTYAYATVRQLALSRGDSQLRLAEGPEAIHGTNMFIKDGNLLKKVLDWMK